MADDLFDALAAALEAAADVLRNWGTADDDTTSTTTEAATELRGTVEERARQQHPQIGDRQLDMLPLLEAAGDGRDLARGYRPDAGLPRPERGHCPQRAKEGWGGGGGGHPRLPPLVAPHAGNARVNNIVKPEGPPVKI